MRFTRNILALRFSHGKPNIARRTITTNQVEDGCEKLGSTLRFDGQTAIVTGAGRGLGRGYALLLASRGANVVVNDPDQDGQVAAGLVEQINNGSISQAGKALANCESISQESGAKRLFEATMSKFGRVDILINNAGILRDKSFSKMTIEDWDQVISVHLRGSFLVTHACWAQMRAQKYGRIVMTSSTSGLFGNFGQANYAAAKMGLIGLSNTLAIEGQRDNIQCNTIVPMAASRMTQSILPEPLAKRLDPAHVAPMVAWLCHTDCKTSGSVFEAAGKWFGQHRLQRSHGLHLASLHSGGASLERLVANWDKLTSFEVGATPLDSFNDHLAELMQTFDMAADDERDKSNSS